MSSIDISLPNSDHLKQGCNEHGFWKWFEVNHHRYLFINEVYPEEKEKLLDEFLHQLHAYCKHLFFVMGGHPFEDQELIITADGDVAHFGSVESLINAAPIVKGWKVIAFKPGIGFDFKMEFKDLTFDPSKIWFLPMASASRPDDLGLRIGFRDFDQSNESDLLAGTFLLLNNGLGEHQAVTEIKYVQVSQLPEDPESAGYIKLNELADYIAWWKDKGHEDKSDS